MKLRVKFAKYSTMRFIGHLDIMRYFQKGIRRMGLPIRYSEGFSPHQIMTFGAPLSLGVESMGEYMDIEMVDEKMGEYGAKRIKDLLSSTMCEGLEIISVRRIEDACKAAMTQMVAADFRIIFSEFCAEDVEMLQYAVKKLLDAEEILVQKKVKIRDKSKGYVRNKEDLYIHTYKEVNIRPLIYSLLVRKDKDEEELLYLDMCISQGSIDNLKPEFVISELKKSTELSGLFASGYRLFRMEMYAEGHKSLEDFGEEF